MEVEYIVGVFLTETDIVTHAIPETIISNEHHSDEKINNTKNVSAVIRRKTEQTTKKKNKQKID